jgi:hypothetical protein
MGPVRAKAVAPVPDGWLNLLVIAESVADIDAERHHLDSFKRGAGAPIEINGANSRKTLDDLAGDALDRMGDATQLDLEALWDAVSEPAAPVVTHRRRRVA